MHLLKTTNKAQRRSLIRRYHIKHIMKQKIVIKVQMNSDKRRRKALKIAVVEPGVTSVSIEGADRDQVVVIGNCVDSVCLANALRKKFCYAKIELVEEVKDKPKADDDKKYLPLPYYYSPCPPSVVYDYQSSSACIIM